MYNHFQWPPVARGRNRLTQNYEPIQPFMLLELARVLEMDAFLDIGANIGVYSVFMSTVPSIAEIHAFEAAPQAYEQMQAALAANNLEQRVQTHPLAVSSERGQLKFGLVSDTSGANSVVDSSIHEHGKFSDVISVDSVPLDEIFSWSGRTSG